MKAQVRSDLLTQGVVTGDKDIPYLQPLLNARNELKERAEQAGYKR